MKIRKACQLESLYAAAHSVNEQSPDVLFMKAVCAGDIKTVLSFFREEKLFGGAKCAVDTPYGRYEGLEGIRLFADGWLDRFDAQHATLTPVIQTIANGRAALEAVVNFSVDRAINQVPMVIVTDFRTPIGIDEVRIYCHFTYVPRLQAYRKPIFPSAYLEVGDPGLLTGAVREYFEALHHCPALDVDRIMAAISQDCVFGGYEPWDAEHGPAKTREDIRGAYERMSTYIPRCVGMRYETIIDDGRTCVIEWVHLVSRAGREERGRVAMSGVSAYERDDQGLLCSIRISDYAGYEHTIDWAQTGITMEDAQAVNFVESFPPFIGKKPLT